MAGFFKKALGLFVELPTDPEGAPVAPAEPDVPLEQLDAELQGLVAELEAASQTQPELPAVAAPAPPDDLPIGVPLPELYAQAKVPASPFSAEMLLRVAENLRGMPLPQARTAVQAMDAADERWTVGDVVHDAERKISALEAVMAILRERATLARQAHQATASMLQAQLVEVESDIDAQIAELHELKEQARQDTQAELAASEAERKATERACGTEEARLLEEVERLRGIFDFFEGSG